LYRKEAAVIVVLMESNAAEHYSALVARWLTGPACITWVSGAGVEKVAEILGADISSSSPMSWLDAQFERYDEDCESVLIGEAGAWVIALEPNGWEGSLPEQLNSLSKNGKALNLYWDGPVRNEFRYSVNGQLTMDFNRSTSGGAVQGIPFPDTLDDSWKISALVLAEQLTGVRVGHEWMESEHLRFILSAGEEED